MIEPTLASWLISELVFFQQLSTTTCAESWRCQCVALHAFLFQNVWLTACFHMVMWNSANYRIVPHILPIFSQSAAIFTISLHFNFVGNAIDGLSALKRRFSHKCIVCSFFRHSPFLFVNYSFILGMLQQPYSIPHLLEFSAQLNSEALFIPSKH